MYCPFCRAKVSDEVSFCPNCGADLAQELDEKIEEMPDLQEIGVNPAPGPKHRKLMLVIIAIVSVALVATIVGIVMYVTSNSGSGGDSSESEQAAETETEEGEADAESEDSEKDEEKKDEESTSEDESASSEKDDAEQDSSSDGKDDSAASGQDGTQTTDDGAQTNPEQQTQDGQNQETAPPQDGQQPQGEGAGETKSLEFNGVTCQIPNAWITKDVEDGKQVAASPSENRGVYIEHVPMESSERADLIGIAVAYALDDDEGRYQNLEIVGDPIQVSLDGGTFEGIRLESRGDQEGEPRHYLDQWVQTQHGIILMRVTSAADEWEQARDELMGILDSIHIQNTDGGSNGGGEPNGGGVGGGDTQQALAKS